MFKRLIASLVILCFNCSYIIMPQARAAEGFLNLPVPGTMVSLSPAYQPALIKGMTINKDNPFLFDFIIDPGRSGLRGDNLKQEGDRLVRYFFACLTIPEKDLWVNLSPYEKEKMVPRALGQTPLGRDLLAQDYILKQLTASMIYPERNLGKEFWNRVYAKAEALYGTTQIPINTFNKVWIVADKADVYENGQTVVVLGGHLKVMLEGDYLAMDKHADIGKGIDRRGVNNIGSQIVREIVLPEIEKEVNTGKNFAPLRQIFNSLILATWYKKNLKEALLSQIYADKSIVKGVNLSDPSVKEKIYQRYLRAYKKGVFNFIKEDTDTDGQMIPRKYFSGGFTVSDTMLSTMKPGKLSFPRFKQWATTLAPALFILTVFTALATPSTSQAAATLPEITNNVVTTAVAQNQKAPLDPSKVYTKPAREYLNGIFYRGTRVYFAKDGQWWVRVGISENGQWGYGQPITRVLDDDWSLPHRVKNPAEIPTDQLWRGPVPRSDSEILSTPAERRSWAAQQQGALNIKADAIARQLDGYKYPARKRLAGLYPSSNDGWIVRYKQLLDENGDAYSLSVQLAANVDFKNDPFRRAVAERLEYTRLEDGSFTLKFVPKSVPSTNSPSVSPAMMTRLNLLKSFALAGLFLSFKTEPSVAQTNQFDDPNAVFMTQPGFRLENPHIYFRDNSGTLWERSVATSVEPGTLGAVSTVHYGTPHVVTAIPERAVRVEGESNWKIGNTNQVVDISKRYSGMDPQTLRAYVFSFNGNKNHWEGETQNQTGDFTDRIFGLDGKTMNVPRLPSWASNVVPEFTNTDRGNFKVKTKYTDGNYQYYYKGGVWWALRLTPNGTDPMQLFPLKPGHFPPADAKASNAQLIRQRVARVVIRAVTATGRVAARVWRQGGIDLNAENMGMVVKKDSNGGVQVNFNPEMIERFKTEGVWSADPIIVRVSSISPAEMQPLLGVTTADN